MHTYYAAKDEYTEKCRSQAFYFLTFDTFHKYNHFFLGGGGVTSHLEKLRTLKKKSNCVNFGTSSTHFDFFFKVC